MNIAQILTLGASIIAFRLDGKEDDKTSSI
jgi:hypothetical protein